MSTAERPTSRPSVVQALDDEGVLLTGWYGPLDAPLLPPARSLAVAQSPPGPHRPLLYAAIGTLAVGGALYGAAWGTHSQYGPTPADPQASLVAANHMLTLSSFGVAGAGVALGVAAFFRGSW